MNEFVIVDLLYLHLDVVNLMQKKLLCVEHYLKKLKEHPLHVQDLESKTWKFHNSRHLRISIGHSDRF